MNKSASMTKNLMLSVLCAVGLPWATGCYLLLAGGASIAAKDAEYAAACAENKGGKGSPAATTANEAMERARKNRQEAADTEDTDVAGAAFLAASAAADDAIVAAAGVPGCASELKPRLAGSYRQDIFQKGPHS